MVEHLVLLPGMDGTGELFSPLERALDGRLKTQRVRYPDSEPMGYALLEPWVRARLPQAPFVLLGESFSGPLALSIAAAPPEGLRGVILGCSFARNPRPVLGMLRGLPLPAPAARLALWGAMPLVRRALLGAHATPALRQLLEGALRQVQPTVLVKRCKEVLRIDVRDRLRGISLPVLALAASEDRLVPRTCTQALEAAQPHLRTVTLAGPHCLLQAAPAACAQEIARFCEGLEEPRA